MSHPASPPPAATDNPYLAILRAQRPVLIAVLVFSAFVNVLMLTGSIYMLQVYDRVLSSGSIPTLLGLFAIVVVLFAFLGLFDFLRTRLLGRVGVRLDLALGARTFATWLGGGSGNAGNGPQPLQQLDTLRGFVSGPAIGAVFDLPFVPLFVGVLFLIHPWLGLLVVAGSGFVAVLALIGRRISARAMAEAAAQDATAQAFGERARAQGDTIAAMGMARPLTGLWRGLRDGALAGHQRAGNPAEVLAALSKALRLILQSAILTLGALLVLRGEITAGMIIAASILSGRAMAPVDQIIGQWRAIGRAGAAHRNLRDFFADTAPQETANRVALPRPTGQITVTRLTKLAPGTGNAGDRPRILTQVGFSLNPGDGLGVVGNSAAGKSTLARLITGIWAPDGGEIRFDGATADQWDPAVLGAAMGYLPQSVDLLPGSIGQNIARFIPGAQDDDIIAAARLAGVHEMILALPDGYGTRVGDRSADTPLSGGQIQRLGLARAVFGPPAIVVLDEPNSNLDAAGDDALAHAIKTLRAAGSTVIVMAHRPSAMAAVNKVLILHSGMVAKFGPRDEVLNGTMRAPAPAAVTPINPAAAAPAAKSSRNTNPQGGGVSKTAPTQQTVRLADPPRAV